MRSLIAAHDDTSQAGEIRLLREIVEPDFPRYIVDVGAHDGRSLSNSFPFVSEGWSAVMVEPLPEVFERLRDRYRGRPDVHCFNCACSDFEGTAPLFIGNDGRTGMLSSLCSDDTVYSRQVRGTDRIMVRVTTLNNLLRRSNAPRDFSILLVDAEGMDYEVLAGLDFDRFRPRIVMTEEYQHDPRKHLAKYRLLRQRGYFLWRPAGVNTIWIDRRFRRRHPRILWSNLIPTLGAGLRGTFRIAPIRPLASRVKRRLRAFAHSE